MILLSKHKKVWKYFVKDCLQFFLLILASLKMLRSFKTDGIYTQKNRKTCFPIQDGLFGGFSGLVGALISHLKKTQKIINPVPYPLSSVDISIFPWEIGNFRNIGKWKQNWLFHTLSLILLRFNEYLYVVLINMIAIPAKLFTSGLIEIKIFCNKV